MKGITLHVVSATVTQLVTQSGAGNGDGKIYRHEREGYQGTP
jgi:hypothetical protein